MPDHGEAVDTAWRIHDSVRDWTGKVDVKAAFALSIESAALLAILANATGKHRLGRLHDGTHVLFVVGITAIVVGGLCAVLAVTPHIRTSAVKQTWQDNFIYFGHLRYWQKRKQQEQLQHALMEKDVLPMLGRQLAVMGTIAWRKHRYLQASFLFAVAGSGCVGLAALLG